MNTRKGYFNNRNLWLLIALMTVLFSHASYSQIMDSMFVFREEEPRKKADSIQYTKSWGLDIIASENGFGLGTFFKRQFNEKLSGSINITFSEGKDGREVEYTDYWGYTYTPYKKTRVIMVPITATIEYRLFEDDILDTFRPYLNAGLGPVILLTSPFEKEFFSSLKYTQAKYTAGGFIGVGANFGLEKKNLMGFNVRYYYVPYPAGIEVMENTPKKSFGGIYLTLNFGINY